MGNPLYAGSTDSRLRELHEYWLRCRGDRAMPTGDEIELCKIEMLRPWLVLADVGATPADVRFRLAGTELVTWFGQGFADRYLADLDLGDGAETVKACFFRTIRSGEPQSCACELWTSNYQHLRLHFLLLPLSADGERVNSILGAAVSY